MGKGESTSDAAESEIPQPFTCSICLDLLYKPIVLSCGHVSCFWCVHKSMNGVYESHCPICRHPYYHFPTICQMLHSLLLKMYPVTYKRREEQTLEEEKKAGCFSPQLDSDTCGSHGDQDSSGKGECNGNCKQLSIADVQCTACKQVLFRPFFLNCGHGYCETCISSTDDESLKCQVCECLHPNGLPKVCLELNHFLEEQFPREYALRRYALQLNNKETQTRIENPTSSVAKEAFSSSKLHIGVGCDSCGMYPIIGERYKCKDCIEDVGFDLCGECYNTRSKLPGRFNQQHTPEHKLERVNSRDIRRVFLRMVSEQFEDLSYALSSHEEIAENESQGSDDEENFHDGLTAPDIHTESPHDHPETQSSS